MADAQVETFRPTGLLHIEEPTGTDPVFTMEDNFVPNGLLGSHFANQPPSFTPDNPPHFMSTTTAPPFRQDGVLGSASAETGGFCVALTFVIISDL